MTDLAAPLSDQELSVLRILIGQRSRAIVEPFALTPDVLPGEVIASSWGNEVRDRTRQPFDTKADLLAGWANAPLGAAAVTTDNMMSFTKWPVGWLPDWEQKVVVATFAVSGSIGAVTIPHGLGRQPRSVNVSLGEGTGVILGYNTASPLDFRAVAMRWDGVPFAGAVNVAYIMT